MATEPAWQRNFPNVDGRDLRLAAAVFQPFLEELKRRNPAFLRQDAVPELDPADLLELVAAADRDPALGEKVLHHLERLLQQTLRDHWAPEPADRDLPEASSLHRRWWSLQQKAWDEVLRPYHTAAGCYGWSRDVRKVRLCRRPVCPFCHLRRVKALYRDVLRRGLRWVECRRFTWQVQSHHAFAELEGVQHDEDELGRVLNRIGEDLRSLVPERVVRDVLTLVEVMLRVELASREARPAWEYAGRAASGRKSVVSLWERLRMPPRLTPPGTGGAIYLRLVPRLAERAHDWAEPAALSEVSWCLSVLAAADDSGSPEERLERIGSFFEERAGADPALPVQRSHERVTLEPSPSDDEPGPPPERPDLAKFAQVLGTCFQFPSACLFCSEGQLVGLALIEDFLTQGAKRKRHWRTFGLLRGG